MCAGMNGISTCRETAVCGSECDGPPSEAPPLCAFAIKCSFPAATEQLTLFCSKDVQPVEERRNITGPRLRLGGGRSQSKPSDRNRVVCLSVSYMRMAFELSGPYFYLDIVPRYTAREEPMERSHRVSPRRLGRGGRAGSGVLALLSASLLLWSTVFIGIASSSAEEAGGMRRGGTASRPFGASALSTRRSKRGKAPRVDSDPVIPKLIW